MYVCVPYVYLTFVEARGIGSSGMGGTRGCEPCMSVLGLEPKSYVRAESTLNHLSPAPLKIFE